MSLAEGPDEMGLPLTEEGVLRLKPRLRERYLTPDVDDCVVQATGNRLSIWIWSDRENVRIDLPIEGLRWERPYERSVHRWGVNLNRWLSPGNSKDRAGWHSHGTINLGYHPESAQDGVEVRITTHDREDPR